MIEASQGFLDQLHSSRTYVVLADILAMDEVIKEGITVIGGNIAHDSGANIRSRCSLVLQDEDEDLVPRIASDILWPNGNEVRIRYGIILPGGETELVTLGIFRMTRPKFLDTGDGLQIAISGYDRSRTIHRNRFPDPYEISSGTNYIEAISTLIQTRFPFDLDMSRMMETNRNTPHLVFEAQDNPWEAVVDMASSLGAEAYFDNMGNPVVKPEPTTDGSIIDWEYKEGEHCQMTEAQKDLDDERTYNHIIVSGESTDNPIPVRAEAVDNNPESPTYINGPYGRVTYFQASPYITTEDQAQEAANAALLRVSGIVEQVNFGGVPHPLHQTGDVLRIKRDKLRIDDRYILESVRIPFGPGEVMSGTTRQRRII